MVHKPFDTHAIYKELTAKGFPPAVAEALCDIHKNQHQATYDNFVTKDELPMYMLRWVSGSIIFLSALAVIVTLVIEHPPLGVTEKASIQPTTENKASTHAQQKPSPSINIKDLRPAR